MNKYISALCALIIGTLSLTSCLNSSDDSDITYYNDTAIRYTLEKEPYAVAEGEQE